MSNHAPRRRRSGRGRRALSVGATMLACLLWAPPAQAHVELVGSTPAAGDVVSPDIEQMVLAFGEDLLQAADVVVRDRRGADVVVGDPVVTGRSVEVGISLVEPGAHDVSYRVVGLDGHPIVGSYSFRSARPARAGGGRPGAGTAAGRVAAGRPAAGGTAAGGRTVRQASRGTAGPVLAPAAGPVAPDEGTAWLPWTLAAGVLAGLLLVLRGATARTAVVRADHGRGRRAGASTHLPRDQDQR